MPDVNKERMRLWVSALRSGEYAQCRNSIRQFEDHDPTNPSYCCLGVAVKVAHVNGFTMPNYPGQPKASEAECFQSDHLHVDVAEWFGLFPDNDVMVYTGDPVIGEDDNGTDQTAIDANDTDYWNFNQIADQIETYYELREESA